MYSETILEDCKEVFLLGVGGFVTKMAVIHQELHCK